MNSHQSMPFSRVISSLFRNIPSRTWHPLLTHYNLTTKSQFPSIRSTAFSPTGSHIFHMKKDSYFLYQENNSEFAVGILISMFRTISGDDFPLTSLSPALRAREVIKNTIPRSFRVQNKGEYRMNTQEEEEISELEGKSRKERYRGPERRDINNDLSCALINRREKRENLDYLNVVVVGKMGKEGGWKKAGSSNWFPPQYEHCFFFKALKVADYER